MLDSRHGLTPAFWDLAPSKIQTQIKLGGTVLTQGDGGLMCGLMCGSHVWFAYREDHQPVLARVPHRQCVKRHPLYRCVGGAVYYTAVVGVLPLPRWDPHSACTRVVATARKDRCHKRVVEEQILGAVCGAAPVVGPAGALTHGVARE